ncbi:phage regulatory CII family protein [Neptunicella sp.]|uniref:phage regulatory CII family protein n=1 Tax=Neptunicella sp. TaxID=2125986 RepID=UPI003F68C777
MAKQIPRPVNVNSQCIDDARQAFVAVNRMDLISTRMGVREGRLYDKLNPLRDTHLLDLETIVAVTAQSGDLTLIDGLVRAFDYQMFKNPSTEPNQTNIVSMIMRRQKVDGDFADLYDRFLEDGKLDPQEVETLCGSLDDALNIITRMKANLLASVAKD